MRAINATLDKALIAESVAPTYDRHDYASMRGCTAVRFQTLTGETVYRCALACGFRIRSRQRTAT